MLKIVHFSYISIFLIITNVIIEGKSNCAGKLFDRQDCVQPKTIQNYGEFDADRCLYLAQGLRTADGEFIEPRTKNEEVLIAHAKAFENCVEGLSEEKDENDESSTKDNGKLSEIEACVDVVDRKLLKEYDCSEPAAL